MGHDIRMGIGDGLGGISSIVTYLMGHGVGMGVGHRVTIVVGATLESCWIGIGIGSWVGVCVGNGMGLGKTQLLDVGWAFA